MKLSVVNNNEGGQLSGDLVVCHFIPSACVQVQDKSNARGVTEQVLKKTAVQDPSQTDVVLKSPLSPRFNLECKIGLRPSLFLLVFDYT